MAHQGDYSSGGIDKGLSLTSFGGAIHVTSSKHFSASCNDLQRSSN
jgi:hypothetical protein